MTIISVVYENDKIMSSENIKVKGQYDQSVNISFPVHIPEVLCVCRVNPGVILIRQSYQALGRQVLLLQRTEIVVQPLDHELVSNSFQFSNSPPLRLCITISLPSHMYGF